MNEVPELHPEAIRLVVFPGNRHAMVVSRTDREAVAIVSKKHSLVNGGIRVMCVPTTEQVFELTHMGVPTYKYDED